MLMNSSELEFDKKRVADICVAKHKKDNPMMYLVLDKDIIEREIIPHIPIESKGSSPRVPLVEIINAILYKLKTGVQWEYLPVESLFSERPLHYKSVFYHYRKWCKAVVWKDCWI